MSRTGPLGALVLLGLVGCSSETPIESLPPPRAVLDSVGMRLSGSHREADITALAKDGDRLLGVLKADERYALGRDLVRFRVDRPVIVEVAVPGGVAPFWLADQGFAATGKRIPDSDGDFTLYRKAFPTGWIGLGVNGVHRPGHDPPGSARHDALTRPGVEGEGAFIEESGSSGHRGG